MEGDICDELPFFMRSFLLHLHPEMLNAMFGEMIRMFVLPQPGRALAGEHIDAFLIPLLIVWVCWEKIVVERPTCHIVQIQRSGLAAFGVNEYDASCTLIDLALIHS